MFMDKLPPSSSSSSTSTLTLATFGALSAACIAALKLRQSSRKMIERCSSTGTSGSSLCGNSASATFETKPLYKNNPNECLQFSLNSKGSSLHDDLKHVAREICPEWQNANYQDISVTVISGGITNLLYRLDWTNPKGVVKSVLVRLYGEKTEILIDREVENWIFTELAKVGFAPTFLGQFMNGRIEEWFDSRPLEPQEMGQIEPVNFISMIAAEMGTLHTLDLPRDRKPILWTTLDRFAHIALDVTFEHSPNRQDRLKKLDLPKIQEELRWLQTKLPSPENSDGEALLDDSTDTVSQQAFAFAMDVVFCHNDALSGNVLFNNSWDRVKIIDYEYGGYNYRGYDIANHFAEHCGFDCDWEKGFPSIEKQVAAPALLSSLKAKNEWNAFADALSTIVQRFVLATHLLWGLWAVIQSKFSPIDFDFFEYAEQRLEGYYFHKEKFRVAA